VHAVQLEMTQSSYMQEKLPFDYLPEVAADEANHLHPRPGPPGILESASPSSTAPWAP
jgi:hypothetical protein